MYNPTLSRFSRLYRLELRQIVWNWVYLLLHPIWMLLFLKMFADDDGRSAQAMLETMPGRLAIGMISLIALFIVGISASRPQRAKFSELENAFPTGHEVFLARWLAGITGLLGFTLEPLIVVAMRGPVSSLLAALPVFLGELLLTLAFTTAVGWWLSTWLKLGRWSYPLLAGGWLAFFLGPAMLASRVQWMTLLNFMRQGASYYYELWGRLIYGSLPIWFNLFYLGLLILILTLIGLEIFRRRFHRLPLVAIATLLVALDISGFGGARYMADIRQAGNHPGSTVVMFTKEGQSPVTTQSATIQQEPQVEAYDLHIDLTDTSQPSFTAHMTVLNPGTKPFDHLWIFLNPGLKVTGASVEIIDSGDYFELVLARPIQPGETRDIDLRYSGRIWNITWMDGLPVAVDFIHARGVRLSPQVDWYPKLVGDISDPLAHRPARIHLTVSGWNGLSFASNLPAVGPAEFQSEDAAWIFLLGSPHLVTEQAGPVTLITSRNDLEDARSRLGVYTQALAKMRRFFPAVTDPSMVLFSLSEESGLPQGTPPTDGRPVVVTSQWTLSDLTEEDALTYHQVEGALFNDLWLLSGGSPSALENRAILELARFMWIYVGTNGDIDAAPVILKEVYWGAATDENPVYAAMSDVYHRQGEDGIARVTQEMVARTQELQELDAEQAAGWILEAANGD